MDASSSLPLALRTDLPTWKQVILLGWPMLAFCILGLVDAVIGLRSRMRAMITGR